MKSSLCSASDDTNTANVAELGPLLEQHERFFKIKSM